MKQILKIETFYVKPPVNTDEILDSLDWYRRDDRPVQADLTDWNVSQYLHLTYVIKSMSSARTTKFKIFGSRPMDVAIMQKLMTILILIGLLCGIWMPVFLAIRSTPQI